MLISFIYTHTKKAAIQMRNVIFGILILKKFVKFFQKNLEVRLETSCLIFQHTLFENLFLFYKVFRYFQISRTAVLFSITPYTKASFDDEN